MNVLFAETVLKFETKQKINSLLKKLCKTTAAESKIPNAETREAFEETDRGLGLVKAENVDDMFKKLGI